MALSRRLPGCQFQLPPHQALRPATGGGTLRRLFHGGPSGVAESNGNDFIISLGCGFEVFEDSTSEETKYDGDGNTISIGADVTEKELSFAEIRGLKDQLEKENLLLKDEVKGQEYSSEIIGESDA